MKLGIRKGQGVDRGLAWKAWLLWLRLGTKKKGIIVGLYVEKQNEWRKNEK